MAVTVLGSPIGNVGFLSSITMPSATSAPSSRPQTPTAARAGVLSGLDSVLNESSHDGYFGEATTSKVTLDELKRRKLQVLEKRKE